MRSLRIHLLFLIYNDELTRHKKKYKIDHCFKHTEATKKKSSTTVSDAPSRAVYQKTWKKSHLFQSRALSGLSAVAAGSNTTRGQEDILYFKVSLCVLLRGNYFWPPHSVLPLALVSYFGSHDQIFSYGWENEWSVWTIPERAEFSVFQVCCYWFMALYSKLFVVKNEENNWVSYKCCHH